RESPRAPLLRDLFELREVGPAQLARNAQKSDGCGTREDAELRAARDVGRVLDLEAEAEVRLVRSVPQIGLLPSQPGERRLELEAAQLAPDAREDALDQREEVVAVGERELDVELCQLLQPVGAQILVAEAAGDLVVALEAGDYEQLLVDLWALRQCKEAARLPPARDEEGTPAFRCRLRHDRRLDVDEAVGLHLLADDRDEPRTQADVPLHLLPPQVEPPEAEAERLVDAFLVELERQR